MDYILAVLSLLPAVQCGLSDTDALATVHVSAQGESTGICKDLSPECMLWADQGECNNNPLYMHDYCRAACGICTPSDSAGPAMATCKDIHPMCSTWAAIGECSTNAGFMLTQCRLSCRQCQSSDCHDSTPDCTAIANSSSCYTDLHVQGSCPWTCMMCNIRNDTMCTRDRSRPPAAVPGSIEAMFQRIVSAELAELRGATVHVHSTDPWLITIDDFLTSEEADAILAAGGKHWSRSLAGDGQQAVRTSSTSWCSTTACVQDPVVHSVEERVSAVTGFPIDNSEFMQVLRYEEGQFYRTHHDQNSPRSSAWGPRCLTWYNYLSDVEEGGGTAFPKLNITVEPKKGRVALWSSVLDDDPYTRDDRTDHEAITVAKGVKYGANLWLHMYSFRDMSNRGCGNEAYAANWY